MRTANMRIVAFLLVVMTLFNLFPTALAAEVPTDPTEATEQPMPTDPPETSAPSESTVPSEEATNPTAPSDSMEPPEVTSPATEPEQPVPGLTEPNNGIPPEDALVESPENMEDQPELLGGRSFTNLGMYQIMAKSKVYLDPYDTGKYLSSINRMYFTSPTEYAYCIQPGTPTAGSYTQNSNVNPWTRLSANQRKAMGVVLALGFPKTYHHDGFPGTPGRAQAMGDSLSQWQTSEYYAATQIIIWEILRGERSATPPYKRTSSSTFDKFYGFNSPDWYGLLAEYTSLDKLLSNYGVAPSFASSSQSNAPTHEMKFDESSKTYKLTLTDSHNVLTLLTPASKNAREMRHFEFKASGITISRSGSTLTITAPESMGDQLAAGVLVKSNGSTADSSGNCIVWSNGSKQVLISSAGGSAEFPPAYFKLHATPIQRNGYLEIHKIDATNGKNLSGAVFKAVSKDGKEYTIGPTNAQGKAVSGELPLGIYTVSETKAPDNYQKTGQTWTVTLTEAHKTASMAYKLEVKNTPDNGSSKIIKKTSDGKNIAGWEFQVTYPDGHKETVVTGSDGTIVFNAAPGTYTIKEVRHTNREINDQYTCTSQNPQTVTVKSNQTASVTFNNDRDHGKVEIVKKTSDGMNLAGWKMEVTGPDGFHKTFVTGENGRIVSGDLPTGKYTVKEIGHTDPVIDSKYECTSQNPQTVSVQKNQTASVTFNNKFVPGWVDVVKKTNTGKDLGGWQIGIFTDYGCTKPVKGSPFTTDSTGHLNPKPELTPGTYYAKELGPQNDWWELDTQVKQFRIVSGQTASVTFTNTHLGKGEVIKTTNTGRDLDGWKFRIYKDQACRQPLNNTTYVTDTSGKIADHLAPGTYWVKEVGDTKGRFNDPDWVIDKSPKQIVITSGSTASVTFKNEQLGKGEIVKTTNTGRNLDGWNFRIYKDQACKQPLNDKTYTSTISGKIADYLAPGTYWVKEVGDTKGRFDDPYWVIDKAPQKIVIEAGKAASVTFRNEQLGKGEIVKTTNTGKNLDGWQFRIYKDQSCKQPLNDKTYTSDSSGKIADYLAPGTYWVKEVGDTKGRFDDPYWVIDKGPQKIIIRAGQASSVTFKNDQLGRIEVIKKAVNGSAEGWNFEIRDAHGKLVQRLTTDRNGHAVSDYLPLGSYEVTEIHDRDETYWTYDVNVKQGVTVQAGADVQVTYTNEQFGLLEIIKVMETEGPLDGWQFKITDAKGKEIEGSPFTTGKDGKILTGKLKPGAYTVEELIPKDSIYYCTGKNPQTVTVTEGQTASVSFTNALRPGKIEIEKVDPAGKHLAGAKFMLEWSEDGNAWTPVKKADIVTKGGCTSPTLNDCFLTTGSDGKVTFEGLHPALQYRISEVAAPEGYTLLSDYAYVGPLPIESLTVGLRIVNTTVMILPQTGSASLALVPMLMTMGLTMSAAAFFFLRRKEK